jgi:hypothetical protein
MMRFVQSYARAHAHAYSHTPTRIRMRTHTCSSFKQTEHCRRGLSLQTLSSVKRLEMRTIPEGPRCNTVLVEAAPAPQLAAHIRQPRHCLRGCRPRHTHTQSRPSGRPIQHHTRTQPSVSITKPTEGPCLHPPCAHPFYMHVSLLTLTGAP